MSEDTDPIEAEILIPTKLILEGVCDPAALVCSAFGLRHVSL